MILNVLETSRIAVLLPCLNEELTIGKVIKDFREQLPQADIYVFDNNSTDRSVEIATELGAIVVKEPRPGKGFVINRMFGQVDADYYVMVDGDDTYPAESVMDLLTPVIEGQTDMAIGARLNEFTDKSFRSFHLFGNRLVRGLINWIYKTDLTDILTGYRVFSRKVVDKVPVVSKGFEVETELTSQMLYYNLKILEVTVPYKERPQGSESKINTFADGMRILWMLFSLFISFKPLTFFGSLGGFFFLLGIAVGSVPINDYLTTPNHYVSHLPLAVLAMGLVVVGILNCFLGIFLHSLNWRFREFHDVMTRNQSADDKVTQP